MGKIVKVATILFSAIVLNACIKSDVGPSGDKLLGQSKTSFPFGLFKLYAYESFQLAPYEITLEIKNELDAEQLYIVNGKSCLNFYFASCKLDAFKRGISFTNLAATKIDGSQEKMVFEKEFLNRLERVKYFENNSDGTLLRFFTGEDKEEFLTFLLEQN